MLSFCMLLLGQWYMHLLGLSVRKLRLGNNMKKENGFVVLELLVLLGFIWGLVIQMRDFQLFILYIPWVMLFGNL